jgi:hypothetical protein
MLSAAVRKRWQVAVEKAYEDVARWYAREKLETFGGLLDFGDARERAYKAAGMLLDRAARWIESPEATDARAEGVLSPLIQGAYDLTTRERFLGFGDLVVDMAKDARDTAEAVTSRASFGGLGFLLGAGLVLWFFSSRR